jgi:hypothetical protein
MSSAPADAGTGSTDARSTSDTSPSLPPEPSFDCDLAPSVIDAPPTNVPALVAEKDGYTLVASQPDVKMQKFDLAGKPQGPPVLVWPNDSEGRAFGRIAHSGTGYGLTYIHVGPVRRAVFLPVSRDLVPGAEIMIDDQTPGLSAIAWSHGSWGVVFDRQVPADPVTPEVYFRRLGRDGEPLADAVRLGRGVLSAVGTPFIATSNGFALAASGVLYEIDVLQGPRAIALGTGMNPPAQRMALATNDKEYVVVAGGKLVRVNVGGDVIAGSEVAFAASDVITSDITRVGDGFVIHWSDSSHSQHVATLAPGTSTPKEIVGALSQRAYHVALAGRPGSFASYFGRGVAQDYWFATLPACDL